jgi:hypothetical protein
VSIAPKAVRELYDSLALERIIRLSVTNGCCQRIEDWGDFTLDSRGHP